MKSRKPDWRKGRAQQAVTRSRERQADLMVLLAGSLEEREDTVQRFGWILFQNSLSMISLGLHYSLACFSFTVKGYFHWEKSRTQREKDRTRLIEVQRSKGQR